MKILAVEPDEYYQTKLRQGLSDLGECIIVSSAEGAKEFFYQDRADVLVMELVLPGASGYSLLEFLRTAETPPDQVIVYSRSRQDEDVGESLGGGSTAYFIKGVDSINSIRSQIIN